MEAIVTSALSRSFGQRKAVDNVSLTVHEGEFFSLLGVNGAGKTTLIRMLCCLCAPTSGSAQVLGQDIVHQAAQVKSMIAVSPQETAVAPNLTAKENVELATEICKDCIGAEQILREVGLGDRMDNFPAQLSGGEQQRVSIARALAKKPKLLLCDEPTGALDYQTGKTILKLLQDTCRNTGTTVVVITHNLAITPMADRVITIKSSKVESVVLNDKPASIDTIEW